MQIYRITRNEDVYEVARENGISPIKLYEYNDMTTKGPLPNGREMLIVAPTRTYNAKSGDKLNDIARRFNVKKDALLRMNPELKGKEKLYTGQLLTVKEEGPLYGMINTNGYLFKDCRKERLISVMPYLGYVTVAAAVYKNGKISTLFPTEDAVSLIKSYGRVPMLRIYVEDMPSENEYKDFINSITVITKGGGFSGVTISSLNTKKYDKHSRDALVFTARRTLMEADLLLFAEGDAEKDTSYMEYADAGILTYDKLHRDDIPSFKDGEESTLKAFADIGESSRTFVEISSFAYCGQKFIEKSNAMQITDRHHADIINDEDKKISIASYGKKKKHEIRYENLENTKAKLELISELGFMGAAFDIGRVCTSDLMMLESMFNIILNPIITPISEQHL